MRSIQNAVFRRILAATLSCSVILCASIFLLVAQEFRGELRSQSANAAELILTIAQTTPVHELQTIEQLPQSQNGAEHEYVLAVYTPSEVLYASWPNPPSDISLLDAPLLTIDGEIYQMEHHLDPTTYTRVVVGMLERETILASLEIVAFTVLAFLLVMAAMLWLIRGAIAGGLVHIHRLADEVTKRHHGSLQPIDLELPPELRSIANATSNFMVRLREAIQREREFVSNAAHELRTPLAGIIAQTEAIPKAGLPDEVADPLEKIRQSAKRSARQVNQLLDHAFSQSQVGIQSTPVEICKILTETLVDLTPAADHADVEIEFHCPQTLQSNLPAPLLQIVFQNLIVNALKFSNRPGRVRVTCELGLNKVEVTIEDNGPGLSADEFHKAQSRFGRSNDQPLASGHGLGLAIVGELCADMGIQIDQRSSSDLGGLSAKLLVPILKSSSSKTS